jgi:hypothetical protein
MGVDLFCTLFSLASGAHLNMPSLPRHGWNRPFFFASPFIFVLGGGALVGSREQQQQQQQRE